MHILRISICSMVLLAVSNLLLAQHVTVGGGVYIKSDSGTVIYLDNIDLDNSGEIRLRNQASLIQTNAVPSNSGNGNYIVERVGTNYRGEYNYWSSPVLSLVRNDVFAGATASYTYFYDETTQEWAWAGGTSNLNAGEGIIATGSGSYGTSQMRTFQGVNGFHSGDYTVPVWYDDDGGGNSDTDNDWNLIGNPYPSGISAGDFLTDNAGVIDNAIYLWNSDGYDYNSTDADYAVMNTTGVTNAGGSTAPPSANIASTQGFFVRGISAGNITFSNSQRVGTNNTFLRTNKSDWERIWITAKHEDGAQNQILLGFIPDAEEGDDKYDAVKLSGSDKLSFYSRRNDLRDDDDLAIQGLPSLDAFADRVIPLGIQAKESGNYTFNISHTDNFSSSHTVYLYDAEAKASIKLNDEDYTVRLEEGEYKERFSLQFVSDKVTGIDDELSVESIWMFASQKHAVVHFPNAEIAQSEVAVFNTAGQLVYATHNKGDLELKIPIAQTGIYIIRIENKLGFTTKKVFVD